MTEWGFETPFAASAEQLEQAWEREDENQASAVVPPKNLGLTAKQVRSYDVAFLGQRGREFTDLVAWAAREVDLNPGLVADNLIAEAKRDVYLATSPVSSYAVGVDDFYERRAAVKAAVPAYSKIKWDPASKREHYNDNRDRPRLVTTIDFASGKDAALASAVTLKYIELDLIRTAGSAGRSFVSLPIETRFALIRLAFNAGIGRARTELRAVLKGGDVLVRTPRKVAGPQRNATIHAGRALHLSRAIFGVDPQPRRIYGPPAPVTNEGFETPFMESDEQLPGTWMPAPVEAGSPGASGNYAEAEFLSENAGVYGQESGEVEESEASETGELYVDESAPEEAEGAAQGFPLGVVLAPAAGKTGEREEHWDPYATGLPLLNTGPAVRNQRLSTHFTVGELVRSGGRYADVARISPALVRLLQGMRDRIGRPVQITSGYRSWSRNRQLYTARGKQPTLSRHCSGQAADIRIPGMSGLDIAKLAIDVGGPNLGVGIGGTYAHVDVRNAWAQWTYLGGEAGRRATSAIKEYRARSLGAVSPAPRTAASEGSPARPQSSQGATSSGRLIVPRHPVLKAHAGTAPDLVVAWNSMDRPSAIDVVVHLHGFSANRARMSLVDEIAPISGLDLAGRTRPTLSVLPRGHYYGGKTGRGYSFPKLVLPGALERLIADALTRFSAHTGVRAPRGRLILTAHSGGGAALNAILGGTNPDPDEVIIYDGVYGPSAAVSSWALRRLSREVASPSTVAPALRVFYRAGSAKYPGTQPHSEALAKELCRPLGSPAVPERLRNRFRVEKTTIAHGEIPRAYGRTLLSDAGSNVPQATRYNCSGGTRKETEARDPYSQSFEDERYKDERFGDESFEEDYQAEEYQAEDYQGEDYRGQDSESEVEQSEAFEESLNDAPQGTWSESEWTEAEDFEPELFGESPGTEPYETESYEPGQFEAGFYRDAPGEYEDSEESEDFEETEDSEDSEDSEDFEESEEPEDFEPENEEEGEEGEGYDPVDREGGEPENLDDEELEGIAGEESWSENLESDNPRDENLAWGEREDEAVSFEGEAFPSGVSLPVTSGATGRDQEHWDPKNAGLPLLVTGPAQRGIKLAPNFTVGELVYSGGKHADVARISPALVRLLQAIRDRAGRPVQITSGYRSWKRNKALYSARGKKPTLSRHCSGQAADIRIRGLSGLDIAKIALDVGGPNIAIGLGRTFAHVDVRGVWTVWNYVGGTEGRALEAAATAHRAARAAGTRPLTPTRPSTQPARPAPAPVTTAGTNRQRGVVPYQSAKSDSKGPQPGALALRAHWRKTTGLQKVGIYVLRDIRGKPGKLSVHSEGRALDLYVNANDPAQRIIAEKYVAWLIANAVELQCAYIIWNFRQWSWQKRAQGWRPYKGQSPHTDHIHVELSWEGAKSPSKLLAV